jgi:hypothetical protein
MKRTIKKKEYFPFVPPNSLSYPELTATNKI